MSQSLGISLIYKRKYYMAPNLRRMIEEKKKERQDMISYLLLKVKTEDFHGVADAANDIREIDSEIKGMVKAYELSQI